MTKLISLLALACVFTRSTAPAQLVADGATNTLSHVTNNFPDSLTVGTNGSFTLLVLSTNALLTHAADGVIGREATARSNEVRLAGPGARWFLGGSLLVGSNGPSSRLMISNSAQVRSQAGELGRNASLGNRVVVTGPGSSWSNATDMIVGRSGSGNLLLITNGGSVRSDRVFLSVSSAATGNMALVTGPGSAWDMHHISLGDDGSRNQLIVTNGGWVRSNYGQVGAGTPSGSNLALVTGMGSLWSVTNELSVGHQGRGNQLRIIDGGEVAIGMALYLGANPTATNGMIEVNGGSLRVTNSFGSAIFNIRRGTNVLQAGRIDVDELLLTNMAGRFEFNGGTLSARNTRSSHVFRVGDGVQPSTLNLAGNGHHAFSGVQALNIQSNASLTGSGTISGGLRVFPGGTLSPGVSAGEIGRMVLSNSSAWQGATILDLARNGTMRTNDFVQVMGDLTCGGSLTVIHRGPSALALGDRFQLLAASNYMGAFSSVSLPALAPGLEWNDRLLLDGSMEVVRIAMPVPISLAVGAVSPGGAFQFSFANTAGVVFTVLASPDPSLPLNEWSVLGPAAETAPGQFQFVDADAPNHPHRFYCVRTP